MWFMVSGTTRRHHFYDVDLVVNTNPNYEPVLSGGILRTGLTEKDLLSDHVIYPYASLTVGSEEIQKLPSGLETVRRTLLRNEE